LGGWDSGRGGVGGGGGGGVRWQAAFAGYGYSKKVSTVSTLLVGTFLELFSNTKSWSSGQAVSAQCNGHREQDRAT